MNIVVDILQAYVLCLIVRAILSWFPLSPGSPIEPVNRALAAITEPVLRPIRRVVRPVQLGGMGLDLSFLILLFLIEFIVIPLLRG
ncbi:MAG: YggT family protein [Actinobacteria bacterium]|jgi:YggT family protein|nr:YggT family protein [Actinomycetota bacterium]MCL6095284.1 YggT family protein [Actinomycetota bacterium]